jgi:hypothetical protein
MRRSKVSRLPPEVREEIERLWREGRYTLDELVLKLREMGPPDDVDLPSRAGLGAYLHRFDATAARMREAEQVARAVMGSLGEDGERGDVGRMLTQMLRTISFNQLHEVEETGEKLRPADLMFLSKAVKEMVAADKVRADLEIRLRDRLRLEAERKVAAEIETAKNAGADHRVAALEEARELVRGLL